MPSTYDKDKPWDTDDIDKWKVEKFKPEDNAGGSFLEESHFSTMFPRYREVYLREAWPGITRALQKYGIACELDLVSGSMAVRTTRKTYDPAAILNARDLIMLLARSVPAPQALRILEDDTACDIIKIRNLVASNDSFVKRRQRLVGEGGTTLKSLELLTKTYILVQGGTVAAMGPHKGLKDVRRVVEATMHNMHPVYLVRELMVKQNLAKDPAMADESWAPYLPKSQKKSLPKRRVPHKVNDKSKKPYTPFPPAPEMSKMDLEMESGEFFASKEAKKRAVVAEREEKARTKMEAKKRAREEAFVPPEEDGEKKKKKKRKAAEEED